MNFGVFLAPRFAVPMVLSMETLLCVKPTHSTGFGCPPTVGFWGWGQRSFT
jgi:hypothetical protein